MGKGLSLFSIPIWKAGRGEAGIRCVLKKGK